MKKIAGVAAMLICASAAAQERHFESWSTGKSNAGSFFAGTASESGALLVQYCDPGDGNCFWFLGVNISCEDGSRYPVLVNADSGAASHEIYCLKSDGSSSIKGRYAFANFERIDASIRAGGKLGVAFPMQNGLFQVSRFKLDGAVEALKFMNGIVDSLSRKNRENSTKDSTL